MISSAFWTPQLRNKHIPYKLHYYFYPFLYFLSRSTRSKGNKNAPGIGFELQDVMQFMDFRVFESTLGS